MTTEKSLEDQAADLLWVALANECARLGDAIMMPDELPAQRFDKREQRADAVRGIRRLLCKLNDIGALGEASFE